MQSNHAPNFPGGKMQFSNLSLWDENMKLLQPQWTTTHKPCDGRVTVDREKKSITIEHGDA